MLSSSLLCWVRHCGRKERHGIAEMEAAAREKRPVGALDWVEHMGLPNGPGRLAGGDAHRYE